jgi:hypothetical protein
MNLAKLDILEVWNAAGGGPLRGKRGRAFWRNGDGWNISLDRERGTWYDHRDARGGGSLALVETALGCDRRTALQWLEANCGLEPARSQSPGEHRTYRHELDDAEYFGIAAKALAQELLEQLDACDPARINPTRMLGIIRAGGSTLINEYQTWLGRNPEFTRAMVLTGVSSEARVQRRLALYLVELANAA